MRRRGSAVIIATLATALVFGLALRWGPAVTLSAALAAPHATFWSETLSQDVVRDHVTLELDGRALRAHLYRPPTPRAGIVLVHGLSRAGPRHPDLVHLARLLAGRGQLVLVPELEGLVAFRVTEREVEEIRAAAVHLATSTATVGIAGFSFGAGPAILAAAGSTTIRLVGSFGGYADLRNVIAYVTTGVHTYHDRRYASRPQPYNRFKLLALLAGFVSDDRDARILEKIAERRLRDPADDTAPLEEDLGAEGSAVLALVKNEREEAVASLIDALPLSAREALDRLSPLAALPSVSGRLLIAHGEGDDSIPFTESLRLAEVAGERAQLTILRTFSHADAQQLRGPLVERVRDASRLVRLADDLLAVR
jgi:hypothetical protein